MTELNLEEKEVGNRIRYISKSNDVMEQPILPKTDRAQKSKAEKPQDKKKPSAKQIEEPVELK